jgi:hypothetical protein
MPMDITIMGMDMGTDTTTINHHEVTIKTCLQNPLWGTKKPYCHITGSMAFFIF